MILHRCGEDFYFLLVCTWRNENELWETVWAKDGDERRFFHPWPVEGAHRPTFCVWELGAVCHERQAWSRFLRSSRDAVAKKEYLEDTYTGSREPRHDSVPMGSDPNRARTLRDTERS